MGRREMLRKAALCCGLAMAAMWTSACGSPQQLDVQQPKASTERSVPAGRPDYDVIISEPTVASLDELVVRSTQIVVATVTGMRKGVTVTDGPIETSSREVLLRVEEVLKNEDAVVAASYHDSGWATGGGESRRKGIRSTKSGERGVYFLVEDETTSEHRFLLYTSSGRYVLDGQGGPSAGNFERRFPTSQESKSEEAFLAEVRDAVERTRGQEPPPEGDPYS